MGGAGDSGDPKLVLGRGRHAGRRSRFGRARFRRAAKHEHVRIKHVDRRISLDSFDLDFQIIWQPNVVAVEKRDQ